MFTGIVQELGGVRSLDSSGKSARLTVSARTIGADVPTGASVAVNGVCLTIVDAAGDDPVDITFDVMAETLTHSVIGQLRAGDSVNLERGARVDSHLDGHVVQGHVDGTGTILSRTPGENWELVRFGVPAELARYVAKKGAIAVDGVSLTVTNVGPDWFEIGLIPETLRATTLGIKRVGDSVNLEVDALAKYVERLLSMGFLPGSAGSDKSAGSD